MTRKIQFNDVDRAYENKFKNETPLIESKEDIAETVPESGEIYIF